MAEPLIIQLQRLASESSTSVADLVRKALIVAAKLHLHEFEAWLQQELHGYEGEVPEYRKVRAQLCVRNPYHGYQPFFVNDAAFEDKLTDVSLSQPITELVALISGGGKTFYMPFSGEAQALLMRMQDSLAPLPVERSIPATAFTTVVESVRTTILEWALRLEREGVVGENFSFSGEEQQRAASLQNIHIENFQGILGDVTGSSVTQSLKMRVKKHDFTSLASALHELKVPRPDIEELERALVDEPLATRPVLGPKVSTWMGRMVSKAASGALSLSMETSANLLASLIWAYYGSG